MTNSYVPARGDFARMVLDAYTGREQGGERPVLVLGSRSFNAVTRYALVAAITRRVRGWPFEVRIEPNERVSGVVLADQTRSLDYVARHVTYLGAASRALVGAVCQRVTAIVMDHA
jgi:mRNA interferase MazF